MKSQQMRFKMRYLKKINEIFWPGSGSTTGNKDNIEKNFDKISEILSKECSQFLNLLKGLKIQNIQLIKPLQFYQSSFLFLNSQISYMLLNASYFYPYCR